MPKKDDGKEGEYYAYLDEGVGVKLPGLGTLFQQGVPHEIPALFIEDVKKSPMFAKTDKDKKLSPADCVKLQKAEMKKATEVRDAWRKDRVAGKTGKPANAPPADVPTLGVKKDE